MNRLDGRWSARVVFLAWVLWCVAYLGGALLFAGLTKAYPGDEVRFIDTSRLFAAGITTDLLRHYPEMSGPLPFAVFSVWGRMFGWSLAEMRIIAVAIGFAALLLLHLWLRESLGSHSIAFAAGVVLCANPYVAAMSVFLYTDMITVLCAIAALLAVERKRPVLLALSLAAAVLCRQYLVFLTIAIGAYCALESNRRMLSAVLISIIPMGWLIWLWKGLAPASPMREVYLSGEARYHPSALVGYAGLLAIYMLPFLIARWRTYTPGPAVSALLVAISLVAWFFPVRVSPSAAGVGLSSVGLLDRGVAMLLGIGIARDLFYWLAFLASLAMLRVLVSDALKRRLPAMIVVSFLFVMPLSYLYWEKYLLPVIPAAAVAVLRRGHWYPESL